MSDERPSSYLALRPGADVLAADGERVGAVEHVLADEQTTIFEGLVIDVRLGPGGLRFVDAEQVAEIREGAVVLALPAAEVDRLPKPEPRPAVFRRQGPGDSEGPLAHRLRRAWEIVSGRG